MLHRAWGLRQRRYAILAHPSSTMSFVLLNSVILQGKPSKLIRSIVILAPHLSRLSIWYSYSRFAKAKLPVEQETEDEQIANCYKDFPKWDAIK